MTEIADRFEAEIGRDSGLAAEGLAAVSSALRDGDVDTLIVGQLDLRTVGIHEFLWLHHAKEQVGPSQQVEPLVEHGAP